MANKQVTINEMISNTLRTKSTKTPKYYDVLTALGYTLRNDYMWNDSEYWVIEITPDAVLNLSKCANKLTLYITTRYVRGDIKKVDYINLIKMHEVRKDTRPNYFAESRTPRIAQYLKLKERMKVAKSLLETYNRYLDNAQKEYDKAKASVNRQVDALIQAQNDLLDFRDELRGIYKNGHDD